MTRGAMVVSAILLSTASGISSGALANQTPQDQPGSTTATFKSGVDLVRISAIVRDRKGRLVSDLASRDFEVLDDGRPRAITEFHRDWSSVSLALVFDI